MLIDITGQRFGHWVVLGIHPERVRYGKTVCVYWLCRCDCGTERVVLGANLRAGESKSCGCLLGELARNRFTKHGHCRNGKVTSAYTRWLCMRQRCFNSNNTNYANYGARGIVPCERWDKFVDYYADVGAPPEGKSLDRIDNDKGYSPTNVRWATPTEQTYNRRPPKKRKHRRSTLAEIEAYAASLKRAA